MAPLEVPVLLIHGFGSSWDHGWAEPGWPDILADEGRTAIGGDLPGHGSAPKPVDPQAYQDLEDQVATWLGDHERVDAVGFSLGARVLLVMASRQPERFRRLVVMGVGANLFRQENHEQIARAVESGAVDDDVASRVFAQLAADPRNDRAALAAVLRRTGPALGAAELARVSCPVLVVIGDRDFAGPADQLVEALPDARLTTLAGVDHFATPREFRAIDAAVRFLAAP
jgi:pimeloyl-ACP methyl ester carboxylesterase